MAGLKSGDHVLSANALFGSCRYVLENVMARFGVEASFIDGSAIENWQAAMRPNTRMLFLETPSNPTLSVFDIKAIAAVADKAGARLVVDNAFASPALQRPMDFGAHIVVHSTTKWIDGQGRAMGGMILCRQDFLDENLNLFLRNTGPALSPFNAWLHLKSLETLDLRMRAHCDNALKVADFLAAQPHVTKVLYPFRPDHPQYELAKRQMSGGGGVVTFEVAGGKPAAFRFANALSLIDISNNLGDAKSLLTHPETTTHMKLTQAARDAQGVTSGLMRLSVGLEDAEDLCEDLGQALKAI
jgi:O-succinylhomoserine sulfhydrylase